MKIVATLTAIALVSAATLVMAEDKSAGAKHSRGAGMERLKAADTNADGLISRAEAASLPRVASHFDQIDANKDGQLGADEMRAFREARRAGRDKRRAERADEAKK